MMRVLHARDALAELKKALPPKIDKFEDGSLASIRGLLDQFRATHADAMPFALTNVAQRLKTSWQLIHLATKIANSQDAADIAATPYAITVSVVLDQLEDKSLALCRALKNNRIQFAKDILTDVYDIEHALRVRIHLLDESDWGQRLHELMVRIAANLEAELNSLPKDVRHVLGSRSLRSHDSRAERLAYFMWQGVDTLTRGASYCKKLVDQTQESPQLKFERKISPNLNRSILDYGNASIRDRPKTSTED